MHKVLASLVVLGALALAGCGGDNHAKVADVVCPDGTVLAGKDIEDDPAHHDAGFDPTTLCPVPPRVTLEGIPASSPVYVKVPFSWTVDPGSLLHGHSMLTSIRYASAAVADADASLQTYGKELVKKEHQDLPVTFKGNLTFNTPGKVYIRAYAQVQGDNANGTSYARRDVWSAEVVLDVLPVQATGVEHVATHAAGPVGDLEPSELAAALGDALRFANEDFLDHTLEMTSAPPGATQCDLAAPALGQAEATCFLDVPGTYTFATDDVQSKTLTVTVAQP